MLKTLLFLCTMLLFHLGLSAQPSGTSELSKSNNPYASTSVNKSLQAAMRLAETAPDSADQMLSIAYHKIIALHDTAALINYYHAKTYIANSKNRFQEALVNARHENKLANVYGNPLLLAKSFNAIANTYEYLGAMDSAGKYFLAALQIADSIRDRSLQRRLNNNLSSVLYYTGDYAKGLHYAQNGYALAKELTDTNAVITSLLNVGGLEAGLKQYDSSREAFEKVIDLTKQTHNNIKRMDALNNLGELLSDMGHNREALEIYREMLSLSRRYGNPDYRMYAEGNLGNTLTNLARYSEAEPHLAKAISIADTIHAANEMQQWLQFMAVLQQKQGNYRQAFFYLNKYQQLKDSLMNVHTKQNIHRLEIQYETAQKDRQLADQRLDIASQQAAIRRKNTWIIGAIAAFAIVTLLFLLSVGIYRNKKKLHRQTVLSLQKEQEVVRLKALMEGKDSERQRIAGEIHDDIGSGLTTILFLSKQLKTDQGSPNNAAAIKIAKNADLLIGKMREIIWSMNTDYDSLEDLIAYIRQNAGELLENAGINYHFDFPDNIPAVDLSGKQRRNIFLSIKEALHNIIKHAKATEVSIKVLCEQMLYISIGDNGQGITKREEDRFGNGLKNMKQRIESIDGNMQITSAEGTTIELTMPLKG